MKVDDFSLTLGDRIEDVKDGERGTVRFIGEVPPTKGQWIGVEWDRPEVRGKHDGTHDGIKYFEPVNTDHPTPASFVRPTKIKTGISLCQAVVDRYGAVEGKTAGVDEKELTKLCREINAPFVQVVGFDKVNKQQSEFSKLRTVSLRHCLVSNLGQDPSLISAMLPSVQNLDLAENLISSWQLIAEIGQQMKRLKVLTVSCNRLEIPPSIEPLSGLQQLIMGEMNYDWNQIYSIVSQLPALQLLHCHSNRISEIQDFSCTDVLVNLVELNLNSNPLCDWSNVMKFSHLPHLKTIYINECKISSIRFDDTESEDKNIFPSLRCLCMTSNAINDWLSFASLDRLHLVDLRCRDNPILATLPPETARQMLIASISSVSVLNGTEIDRFERYGADIDYLKRYGLDYHAALKAGTLDAFYAVHPRYQSLIKQYGVVDEEALKEKDTSLKSTLLTVDVECPEVKDFVAFSKKLPQTMTVQKLRLLLQRALKGRARAHELHLTVCSSKQPEVKVPLDNDMRDLFFYSVESGDKICVSW